MATNHAGLPTFTSGPLRNDPEAVCTCRKRLFHHYYRSKLPDYKYERLSSPDCIRVFVLPPGEEHAPIRGTIREIDLSDEDHEPYYALSYTWTDEEISTVEEYQDISAAGPGQSTALPYISKPHSVRIGDSKIEVPCNMYFALLKIRHKTQPTALFADALSIAQSRDPESLSERASQIKRMDKIFGRSTQTVVSLGDQDDGAEYCLQTLEQLSEIQQDTIKAIEKGERSLQRATGLTIESDRGFDNPFWLQLTALCKRKWWHRVWVLQEVALARDPYFLVGQGKISADSIQQGVTRLSWIVNTCMSIDQPEDFQERIRQHYKHVLEYFLTVTRARPSQSTPNLWMCQILPRTLNLRSTLFHDRIFGLLGICHDEDVRAISVDYSVHPDELLWRLSLHFVKQGQIAEMFHWLSRGVDSVKTSWEISLDRQENDKDEFDELVTAIYREIFDLFEAGGREQPHRYDEENKLLWLRGVKIGTLATVSSLFPYGPEETLDSDGIYHWMMEGAGLTPDPNTSTDWSSTPFKAADHEEVWYTMGAGYRTYMRPLRFWTSPTTLVDVGRGMEGLCRWLDVNTPVYQKATAHVRTWEGRALVGKLASMSTNRRFGLTEDRVKCLLPKAAKAGDTVWVIKGCPVPFVFRKRGQQWRLVGSTYVHGFMDGEALKGGNDEEIGVC